MAAPIPHPDRLPRAWLVGVAVGRATVTTGLLLLAFAAYQLWGTGHHEARAQEELATELAVQLAEPDAGLDPFDAALVTKPTNDGVTKPTNDGVTEATPAPNPEPAVEPAASTSTNTTPTIPAPSEGEPIATLRIPAIDVDKTVVEGTTREALRTGPGHYRGTPLPGQAGNVAIAGHRTTYGAPFHDIDQLEPGDEIVVETTDGEFTYVVEAADGTEVGHRIVAPDQVGVIADQGDDRLTLTACHPLYSARQRIVVTATLIGSPIELGPTTSPAALAAAVEAAGPTRTTAWGGTPPTERDTTPPPVPSTARMSSTPEVAPTQELVATTDPVEDDLGWQMQHLGAVAGWAGIAALVAATALLVGRLWRRWPAYVIAGPSFALALLTCFAHLDRLIPAA